MTVSIPPHTIERAIEAVLAYLWADEAADYEARSAEDNRGHIFTELKTLQAWLSTPKQMVDDSPHTMTHKPPVVAMKAVRHAPRADALRNERLIDVTPFAATAGIASPTALTTLAWAATIGLPSDHPVKGEIEKARLHALLTSVRYVALRKGKVSKVYFTKFFRIDIATGAEVWLLALVSDGDDGDDGEPVITIMLPGEDYGLQHSAVTESEALAFIKHLVERLWNDEEADYEASSPECKSRHVFGTLKIIRGWLLTREKNA